MDLMERAGDLKGQLMDFAIARDIGIMASSSLRRSSRVVQATPSMTRAHHERTISYGRGPLNSCARCRSPRGSSPSS
jgi:hypothetical protein